MTIRRKVCLSVVLVMMALPELSFGQFQQQFMQPNRSGRGRRLSASVPARVFLPASCLEYGVKTPEPADVFAGVTLGRAFLVGHLPGGGDERLELNMAMRRGMVVVRGTGKSDGVMVEVLAPGWSELDILPGCVAIPPQARMIEVPEASLALVEEAVKTEEQAAKLPSGGEKVAERVLSLARQEHLWGLYSPSWQAFNGSVDPLRAAITQVDGLKAGDTSAARLAWASTGEEAKPAAAPDLAFLGDFAVLRLKAAAEHAPAALEADTKAGVQSAALTRAGLQSLADTFKQRTGGTVVLTNELLAEVNKAKMLGVLEDALAAAGHHFAWRVPEDYLAVQSFEPGPAARRRFVVIAPQTAADAREVFGRNNRAAFAFKTLIDEQLVERVKTAEELEKLAADAKEEERLVLVGMARHGRIAMLDGSELAVADLPKGVSEVITVDAFDPDEPPPLAPLRAGAFTYDGLAVGIRAALQVGRVGPLTRTELVEALSVGIQSEWKRQRAATGPVVMWGRTVAGDVLAAGAGGTMLRVTDLRATQAKPGAEPVAAATP